MTKSRIFTVKKIEPYKKACHYAIIFDDWDLFKSLCPEVFDVAYKALENKSDTHERRIAFGPAIVKELKRLNDKNLINNNPLYKSCHWRKPESKIQSVDLERLERVQSLERLGKDSLLCYKKDYRNVIIPDNAVVFCDPPYQNTGTYLSVFNHEEFFSWAKGKGYYVSEYDAPFECIAEFKKNCSLSSTNNNLQTIENYI